MQVCKGTMHAEISVLAASFAHIAGLIKLNDTVTVKWILFKLLLSFHTDYKMYKN